MAFRSERVQGDLAQLNTKFPRYFRQYCSTLLNLGNVRPFDYCVHSLHLLLDSPIERLLSNRCNALAVKAASKRYQQMVELQQQGLTTSQVAQHLGLSTRTIRRWLAHEHFPEKRHRRRWPSLIDPYQKLCSAERLHQ